MEYLGKNNINSKLINSKNYGKISSETDNFVNIGGICGFLCNNSIIENCENNGEIQGTAKIVTPNEDVSTNVIACISNNGGSAKTTDFGELNIGVIYGKFE